MKNIAELLKDCPKGTKLYSPLCGECTFDRVNHGTIICQKRNFQEITFTSEGYYMIPVFNDAECLLFPSKENRNWDNFVTHSQFKNGDIISNGSYIAIFYSNYKTDYCVFNNDIVYYHCYYSKYYDNCKMIKDYGIGLVKDFHYATEEEKQKLFQAIKDKGYKWNEETKTLEKLIELKFNVGDMIKKKDSNEDVVLITDIADNYYIVETKYGMEVTISISIQNKYELVPNKFDITTLKPFDKVLVRDKDADVWEAHLFSRYYKNSDKPYICIGFMELNEYKQCIPYDSNKELLGTTNDCNEYYKTW